MYTKLSVQTVSSVNLILFKIRSLLSFFFLKKGKDK